MLMAESSFFLGMFTSDQAILANAETAVRWTFPFYVLYAVNQVYLGAIKGLGHTTYPMICTLTCYCLFRVIWCRILIPVFHSMVIVYLSYSVSFAVMFVMLILFYHRILRKIRVTAGTVQESA